MQRATRIPLTWVGVILALLVLGLVAFATVTSLTTREKTLSNETQNLARLSLALAQSTQRVVFSADLLVSSVQEQMFRDGVQTRAEFRRYAKSKAMHDSLQDRVILSPDIDSLLVVDAEGILVNTSRVWPAARLDLTDRKYFTALRDDPDMGYFISVPLSNKLTGQKTIFFARRVSGKDAAFLGLVLASISMSRFEKSFAAVLPDAGASIALYRRDGVLLARQPQSAGASAPAPGAAVQRFLRETFARAEQGTLRTDSVDSAAPAELVAMHTVRGYPLMISVMNSEAVVLAGWRKLAVLVYEVTAAVIVLVALLGYAFLRQWRTQAQLGETARKLVRANDELAAANQGLESFTYSVAHDLRAPLRGIAGYSTLLLRESRDKLDEESAQRLDRINAGAMRMGMLIDDLLQLSRIGRVEMKRRDFALDELARSVVTALEQAHPDRRVEVTLRSGMRANGDPNLIKIVLENLIGNAWKFTARTDGARIEIGSEERDGETRYFVKDNGAGFDMRYAEKLFKAFQRLHRTDEFEGTGIGLSIVYRIVTRHGGRVWAESEPGKQTIFGFTLWKARQFPNPDIPGRVKPAAGSTG